APFPVELPRRLIELYTFRDDLVLDPFMGSGTTAIAALQTDRHFAGYETDEKYVEAALERIDEEKRRRERIDAPRDEPQAYLPAIPEPAPDSEDYQSRAVREGRAAKEIARAVLQDCGFDVADGRVIASGL